MLPDKLPPYEIKRQEGSIGWVRQQLTLPSGEQKEREVTSRFAKLFPTSNQIGYKIGMSKCDKESGRARIVAALLSGTAAGSDSGEAARAEARIATRHAWVQGRIRALRRAHRKADAAWFRLIAPYDDWDDADVPDLAPPPEQAEADAIRAEIDAAIEHERWPRHLYWSL